MKRQIEKRSDGILRFFTPELYIRFGSDDDVEADAADEAWEAAIKAYHQHLRAIRKKLPRSAIALSELCLHDWELLAFDKQDLNADEFFPNHASVAVRPELRAAGLSLQNGRLIIDLIYILADRIQKSRGRKHKQFSDGNDKLWLYDEVDAYDEIPGASVHRILLSDGSEVKIPFFTVVIRKFSVHQNGQSSEARGTTG
jgi:hypothetical protein